MAKMKRKPALICCGVLLAVILALVVVFVALYFTMFRPRSPHVVMTVVSSKISFIKPYPPALNLTFDVEVTVDNPNYASFRYGEVVTEELSNYLAVNTTTAVIVDRSSDGEFLRIDFNISFPALSCEFASVDVSDVLGTNRLNITKTVRKFSIDRNLVPTGSEFHSGPIPTVNKHGDDVEEYHGDGSVALSSRNFDSYSHQYSILVVNFYAPWCYWSNRLKPSWEKTAKIIRERYDPEMDGRILLGKVDCTEEVDLCRRHHIQGYPSIHIFRKGSDIKENHCHHQGRSWASGLSGNGPRPSEKTPAEKKTKREKPMQFDDWAESVLGWASGRAGSAPGHHDHEPYYGERDTESLVAAMETYVANIPKENHMLLEDKSNKTVDPAKRPAPLASGCRIEGFVRVKKVPGYVVISARSGSHSFDPSQINVSHYVTQFSFGEKLSYKMLNELKRLTPYLGGHHDKLAGYFLDWALAGGLGKFAETGPEGVHVGRKRPAGGSGEANFKHS